VDGFPFEFLIWAAIFVAVLLNTVWQQAAARKRAQPQEDRPRPAADLPRRAADLPRPAAAAELPSAAELWRRLRDVTESAAAKARTRGQPARRPREAIVDEIIETQPSPIADPALHRPPGTRRRLLGSRRDLRQAIVLMTILGPCRGMEPPPGRSTADEPPAR